METIFSNFPNLPRLFFAKESNKTQQLEWSHTCPSCMIQPRAPPKTFPPEMLMSVPVMYEDSWHLWTDWDKPKSVSSWSQLPLSQIMSPLASNTIGGHEALRIFSDGTVVPCYSCDVLWIQTCMKKQCRAGNYDSLVAELRLKYLKVTWLILQEGAKYC